MSKPTVAQALQAIKDANGFISHAAVKCNTSRSTLHLMIKDNPKLQEAVTDAREAMKDYAEGKLAENIRDGKEASIFFYLKTQAKDRGYVERQEVTGADGGSLSIKVEYGDYNPNPAETA